MGIDLLCKCEGIVGMQLGEGATTLNRSSKEFSASLSDFKSAYISYYQACHSLLPSIII